MSRDETRARGLAALLAGERPASVARALGVPEGTVRSWKYRLKRERIATLKKGPFGDLLGEHLEAALRSLIEQSKHLADPRVVREMRAGDLAVVFGQLFDRTLRAWELREALTRADG